MQKSPGKSCRGNKSGANRSILIQSWDFREGRRLLSSDFADNARFIPLLPKAQLVWMENISSHSP